MRSNSITFRAVLGLLLFGFVLAVSFVGESDPAAARGFGGGFGRGGGRSFGGMRGGGSHHEMTRNSGRMNQSSSRTGHDTSNKRDVSRASNSNKSSSYSGSKTTTTQGNANTSTSNKFGTNA